MNLRSDAVRLFVFLVATLSVPLSAAAQSGFTATPASMSLQVTVGAIPPSQTIKITNTGGGRLKWTVSTLGTATGWIAASPSTGTNDATVTVSFTQPITTSTPTPLWLKVADARTGAYETVGIFLTGVSSSGTVPSQPPPPPPPPPPPSGVGPQSAITCPAGAVSIWPGTSIQSVVNTYPSSAAFCLRAGTHWLSSSITPKWGNVFVGEYGAILDGSGWATADATQAAFRAHNQDIDYVTIRNLVIRNMPQRGIHAFYYMANNWTVENNTIGPNKDVGIVFGANSIIKNNYIHHNTYSGYMGPYAHNSTLEGNEIAYNGWQQKVMESANVTFRNNFVHHNTGGGIWFDSDNTGALIEGNRVEDNGSAGIWFEIGSGVTIRNNAVRRNETGVFISTSKNAQIYNNTLENNFRGITYFVNCPSLGGGLIGFDLANNSASDNTIIVGTQSGALASVFSYGSCTTTQVAPYANGSKNLTFYRNTYRVPSPTQGQYWYWNAFLYWTGWRAIPQDASGTVSQ